MKAYLHDVIIGSEMPEVIGMLPDPKGCHQEVDLMLGQIADTWAKAPDTGEVIRKHFRIPPITIVVIFAVSVFIFIFKILHSVQTGSMQEASSIKQVNEISLAEKYPEAEAWARSKLDWLWMGWATGWIARWGTADNAALTKIDAKDIPMSDPADECDICFKRFSEVWQDELIRVGHENASLLKVVTRFVTYRKVFAIGFWNAFYEGFLFLGPPLAIKWVTKYLNWLYTQRNLGMVVTGSQLVGPSCLLICIFCGLPLLMAISNSMCTMLNGRIGIRIDGALSLAVYDKAQRLPVVQDDSDDIALPEISKSKKKEGEEGPTQKYETEEDKMFAKENADFERAMASNGVPKRFNLVQVVTSDINTNLMTIPNSLARMVVMVPVLCGTLCLLIGEIGMGFIFSLATAILNLVLMTAIGFMMRTSLGAFYTTSGRRLQFLQEVLAGIRFIKGCGAEQIVKDRMFTARALEIMSLDKFYTIQCYMFIMSLQLPRLYILASLGGYAFFHHGVVEPTVIMSLLPLLMSVQGAIAVVFSLIPTLVMALPSCRRLEAFLKLKEAPRCANMVTPGGQSVSPHCTITEADQKPVLRVQGDFAWQSWAPPTLQDMDIKIPQGSLTIIIGEVGSGKTTLLHAMLGELHPKGDARIEVQSRIAYSAQSAHLFEGSLKDNILKGDTMEHDRYKETIFSSCLVPDLEMLPGGDEVPVGGRGITLSGGQKARVSLARAAYDRADLVMLDDPFAAVDPHTSRHLHDNLIHGPLMQNRTRIIVMQPDTERIMRCNHVIIMKEGVVALQGPPEEVIKTEEYKALQSSTVHGEEELLGPNQSQGTQPMIAQDGYELREEECEGRASWGTITYFCRMGGWWGITTCVMMYLVKNILDMRTQVQLSMWMSHGSLYDAGLTTVKPNPWSYIMNYCVWMCCSTVSWFACWKGGQSWTLNVSAGCHNNMISALMRAPVDRFYDKTPVGRIMNRMANDMMNVDMHVFVGCCSTIGMVWSLAVPLYYVHLTMPLWFTLATTPVYYLVLTMIGLYWKTMVPLRYLMQVSKSGVSSEIAEVESTPATVRAYGMQAFRLKTFGLAVRKMISADFVGGIVCIRWLCNRLFVIGGCFTTGLALITVWIPGAMDVGGASLVINTMFTIIVQIETCIHTGSAAQYQVIAMNRIYEYSSLPEEKEEYHESDAVFANMTVRVKRRAMGKLEVSDVTSGGLSIYRTLRGGREKLLEVTSNRAFVAASGKTLSDLAPHNPRLRMTHAWHRIVAIDGITENTMKMADELLSGQSEWVTLFIVSGWLADGVKVEIQNLRVGYADVPTDVLHSINITIPRRCKVGIVGPTGCGKSTLLLTLLRMLEPRSGAIFIEGVNTQTLGLQTLRKSIGLVPQDPVLLQGSLRFNIDPFQMYPDSSIWEALRLVRLESYVRSLPGALEFMVTGEGANLSFGQRQLLSLARNIVRKPMLLLLDEATSAIDPRTQELLQSTIEKEFPRATLIVIAHRLETILDFDRAVVLDRGRVAEQGPVKELANKKDGFLARMLAAKGLNGKFKE